MITEVFNRVEEKFVVTLKQYGQLTYDLSDRLQYDIYNADGRFYTISNIYYDTPNDRLIRTSMQKPAYKEKLRLRAYEMCIRDRFGRGGNRGYGTFP